MYKRFFFFHFKQKDVLAQLTNDHVRCSTTMQTPSTPNVNTDRLDNINREDNNEDDDEQNFYSAPPSRMFSIRKNSLKIIHLSSK